MLKKEDVPQERFALACNCTSRSMNFNGGDSDGRSGGRNGRMSGRGGGDRDGLYYTHCGRNMHTRETYWNLVGKNHSCHTC